MIIQEYQIQESLIRSYEKEIERLNNEIKTLKNINASLNKNPKYNWNNEKNNLKEDAEKKIKLLEKFMNTNNISLQSLENEFISRDVNKVGEIELDPFIKVKPLL